MEISLFEIERELKTLLEELVETDGEFTSEEKSLRLVNLSDALTTKTDNVAAFRDSLVNFADYLNDKITEIKDRKESIIRKVDKLDQYVSDCMAIQNKTEFNGSLFKISKRKPTPSVEVFDETKIPLQFINVPEPKPTIMKAEIAKAIKAGEIVDGARLVDGKISIQYKVK